MTLNKDVLYYKNETTVKCIVEFDENGSLSNESYIQVIDDLAGNYKINSIIVAAAPSFEELDSNCTLFPAVIVNKIINDTKNGILTMYVSEAEIFDYFDEIDCNITNGTLFDTGIDVGDIKKIKSLEEYFSNATTKSLNNYTNTTIFYSNVTYTELELLCYNISENGTELNELPVINGICNGVSAIDYFGTEYGFDELSFGNVTLGQNNTNFSLSDDIFDFDNTSTPIRRRLRRRRSRRRGRIRQKIKQVIKKVVEVVKEVVQTVINILKGDINKRLFEEAISLDASKTFTVSGDKILSGDGYSGNINGLFSINSGVDFYSGIYCDFIAKYKIFTTNPSFDVFQLKVGGETRFKTYVNIDVTGAINIKIEIAHTEQRKVFMLGPIPIVIKPYATVSIGFEATTDISFNAEFGYEPIFLEYGVEWTKENGWNSIANKQLEFIPYKNFGGDKDESCINFTVTPFIEVKLGIVFYEIVDVSIIPIIHIGTQFQFPGTCDHINACVNSPLQARFSMTFEFNIQIGLTVGNGDIGLPTTDKRFDLPSLNIPTIALFDTCFDVPVLSLIFDGICCSNSVSNSTR
eukprot:218720_1